MLNVPVHEDGIVVFLKWIPTRFVHIDPDRNAKSLLDEAVSEAADSAEQVCDGPSIDRIFFNHPVAAGRPNGAEDR